MQETQSAEVWLRKQCADYVSQEENWRLGGVFQTKGGHNWPWTVTAEDGRSLEAQLVEGGHILPLPKEPAALANVLEVSIVGFLIDRIELLEGASATRGAERGYPDLEIYGSFFGGGFHAVDVKVARRAVTKTGRVQDRTQSRISLYTGNTYFRHPDYLFPGTMRPFAWYETHLDLIAIYTLNESKPGRVDDLELIVQPTWKIASKQRSSTTREYIGAVEKVADLRAGNGEFASPEEFYAYWRKYRFKIARVAEQVLSKGAPPAKPEEDPRP